MSNQYDEQDHEPGLQPIGNLTSRISGSVLSADGASSAVSQRANGAGTTTSPKAPSRQISTRRGALGCKTVSDLMLKNDPDATHRAIMALLPPSVTRSLIPSHQFRSGEWGFEDGWVQRYYQIAEIPEADRQNALAIAEVAFTPAPKSVIGSELTRLRLLTKARAESQDDTRLMAAAYAQEMSAYPADCVVWACRKWARTEKWWPAWSELKALLDRAVAERKALREVLSHVKQSVNRPAA